MPTNPEEHQSNGTTEKSVHMKYLRDFRVEQCPLFLQHKCTQHRPFTCFNWHFMNQKRRRPVRQKDGTFNYSPDTYCTKYDETTGICGDGDECALLHRVAGDVERRYHLRYYKSGMCVHDTDSRGMCVKNGAHCAFAHGTQDLRIPVYDIRELQAMENPELDLIGSLQGPNALDKERNLMADDPKWQDSVYVLANYKTEQCKKPPRLCRQGYACPQFHNNKDRRRTPRRFRYRSTPCPNVKHGDDWGDPTQCDSGDSCAYCHTRTEQQFHPEIYKSTRCHDVQSAGYCPRGAFCAFAHNDQELNASRDEWSILENGTNLSDILSTAFPDSGPRREEEPVKHPTLERHASGYDNSGALSSIPPASAPVSFARARSVNETNQSFPLGSSFSEVVAGHSSSAPGPIAKPRSLSVPGPGNQDLSVAVEATSFFTNGSVTSSSVFSGGWDDRDVTNKSVDSGLAGPFSGPDDRRTSYGSFGGLGSIGSPLLTSLRAVGSPMVHRLGQQDMGDNVNALGSALEELAMEDGFSGGIECDSNARLARDSLAAGLASSVGSSAPVNIPKAGPTSHRILSPPSPPYGIRQNSLSYSHAFSYGNNHMTVGSVSSNHAGSYGSHGIYDHGGISAYSSSLGNNNNAEIFRLKEELTSYKAKLSAWEAGISQARFACDAWKREAEEARQRTMRAEQQRDEAMARQNQLEQQVGNLRLLVTPGGIEQYASDTSLATLKALEVQLKASLDRVSEAVLKAQRRIGGES